MCAALQALDRALHRNALCVRSEGDESAGGRKGGEWEEGNSRQVGPAGCFINRRLRNYPFYTPSFYTFNGIECAMPI